MSDPLVKKVTEADVYGHFETVWRRRIEGPAGTETVTNVDTTTGTLSQPTGDAPTFGDADPKSD